MRLSTLVLGCAVCGLPLTALAVTPRQSSKKSKPASVSRSSHPSGTPSLSSSKRTHSSAGRTSSGAKHGRYGSRPQASMLPAASNYRPSSTSSAIRRPSTARPPFNPNASGRPPYRPVNNRPDVVVHRPDINISHHTINRPVTNINHTTVHRTNVNNTTTVVNQNVVQQNNLNQSVRGSYRPTRTYYPQLHHHWQPSSWSAAYRPAFYNFSYSTSRGSWLSVGTTRLVFVNPFYVRPATTTVRYYDYSRPIRVPDPDYHETADDLVRSERAIRRFDDAREVFRRGEYGRANELIDEAIELLPSDPTLHQFRALVLFARQRYGEAAAALYSVLAVSPGWDGDTVARLYDTPHRYSAQVRELEQFALANPRSIDARFLLAYHYLLKGDRDGALRMFGTVRSAKPDDPVVQSLLAGLRD